MRLRDKVQLKNIPIAKIKTDLAPINQSLQISLLEVEQKDPIKVRVISHPNFDYEIVDGRRRLKAMTDSGVTTVLAYVVTEMDDTELALQALVGNSGTPNEYDEAKHIIALEQAGYTGQQISKMTGYSPATISQRKKLVEKLHPDLQLKLQAGDIKVSTALEATKLPLSEQENIFGNGHNPSYKEVFEFVRAWESEQLSFDIEPENEVKSGLFLTWEQVEQLMGGQVLILMLKGEKCYLRIIETL